MQSFQIPELEKKKLSQNKPKQVRDTFNGISSEIRKLITNIESIPKMINGKELNEVFASQQTYFEKHSVVQMLSKYLTLVRNERFNPECDEIILNSMKELTQQIIALAKTIVTKIPYPLVPILTPKQASLKKLAR